MFERLVKYLPNRGSRNTNENGIDDEVKIHVTANGGLYVDVNELMRSKTVRDTIKRMRELHELKESNKNSVKDA